MRLTTKWLGKEMGKLNERFFDGKIADVVTCRFAKIHKSASGVWRPRLQQILINKWVAESGDQSYATIILLHEMVHAYLEPEYKGYPAAGGHGTLFQGEICRLWRAGAYDDLL